MPSKCAVQGCHGPEGHPPGTFHRFPQNPDLREKWTEALSSIDPMFEPEPNSVVCAKHFLPSDYRYLPLLEEPDVPLASGRASGQLRRLKKGVVPSRFFGAMTEGQSIILPEIQETKCRLSRQKAARQEIAVKSELFGYQTDSSRHDGTDGSSTDDAFEIPTEEVIIKEEREESDYQIKVEPQEGPEQDEPVIVIDDDEDEGRGVEVESCRSKAGPAGGWRFASDIDTSDLLFRVASPEVKQKPKICPITGLEEHIRIKSRLSDFSIEDMKDPQLAAEFYTLTMSMMKERTDLVNENLFLHDQNKKLAFKIQRLKEKIADCDIRTHGKGCKSPPEEHSLARRPAILRRNAKFLKRETTESENASKPSPAASAAAPSSVVAKNRTGNHPLPKAKKPNFSGTYRIVELEYFIRLICDMHSDHATRCLRGKMSIVSETLSGIAGEWHFRCAACDRAKTLNTDRRAKRAKIGGPLIWLGWLQRFGPSSYVEETFDKLNVPFHYAITPNTLDVIEVRREIYGAGRKASVGNSFGTKYKKRNKSRKMDEDMDVDRDCDTEIFI